jgi:hypothetical protein
LQDVFLGAKDKFVRRQLAFMLARQQIVLDLDELLEDQEECVLTRASFECDAVPFDVGRGWRAGSL